MIFVPSQLHILYGHENKTTYVCWKCLNDNFNSDLKMLINRKVVGTIVSG